jgi:serine phosphatase RsbU (regulator of sigma subunit)
VSLAQDPVRYLQIADSIYYSNPDSSFNLSTKAEKMLTDSSDALLRAKAKVFKGRYLLLKSMLEEAEMEFNGAYNIYKDQKDTAGIAYVLKLKSILQERLGNDAESFFLLEESIALSKKTKDYKKAVGGLLNLMRKYTDNGEYYKSEVIVKEIESLQEHLSTSNTYFFNQNKGVLSMGKKKYDEAYAYFISARKIAHENTMIDSEATILMLMAKANRLRGRQAEAISFLKESEKICTDNNLEHEMLDNYTEYVTAYELMGNYKEAFRYQKLKEELSQKILGLEEVNRVAALEKKLAVTEKQKEIDIEKINTQDEKVRSQRLIWFLAFVGLLSVLLVFLFARARKLKNKIQEKNHIVEEKQREILDSIQYAKRIQSALLTSDAYIKKYLDDFFILYKPKDIVSGDFYWAIQHEGNFYMAVADCTGHGVPGAFMSMIGINLLSQIIVERKCTNPALILDILREEIIRNLNGEHTEEESRDGIDMVILKLNRESKQLDFAGANNSVYVLDSISNELNEYKGDKMPVGKHTDHTDAFTKHTLQLKAGDLVYAFTDGFPDQFGGPKGKKFKYKQLEELLRTNASLATADQRTVLDRTFENWKGNLEQVDDVCIIGIRI